MSDHRSEKRRKAKRKGGRLIPALCNVLGFILILGIIAICLPLSLKNFMDYRLYDVVSPSMEPEIPVGSLIVVKELEPEELKEGDIIAFMVEGSVVTHRVTENHVVEGEFVTKGDANDIEDFSAVPYEMVIGRVEYHFKMLGQLMELLTTIPGKMLMFVIAACGVMLNILASRLREIRDEKES